MSGFEIAFMLIAGAQQIALAIVARYLSRSSEAASDIAGRAIERARTADDLTARTLALFAETSKWMAKCATSPSPTHGARDAEIERGASIADAKEVKR